MYRHRTDNYWLLPTALTWEVMHSPPSVRLSVYFHPTFGTDWPLTLKFCMWVGLGHDHSSQGIEGQGHRSKVKVVGKARSRAVFLVLVFVRSFDLNHHTLTTSGVRQWGQSVPSDMYSKSKQLTGSSIDAASVCIERSIRDSYCCLIHVVKTNMVARSITLAIIEDRSVSLIIPTMTIGSAGLYRLLFGSVFACPQDFYKRLAGFAR